MSNWHIGQEIVWVGIRGNESVGPGKVIGIRNSCCKCKELELETTLETTDWTGARPRPCLACGMLLDGDKVGRYRSETCFRPLVYDANEIALLKSIAETGIHVKELSK